MYKKLKQKFDGAEVVRTDMIYNKTEDLYIPADLKNADYQAYLEWAKTNTAESAD